MTYGKRLKKTLTGPIFINIMKYLIFFLYMTKKKKILLAVIAVLVVGTLGYKLIWGKKAVGPEYVTAKAEQRDLSQTVSATGKIKTAEPIDLNFQTTGRIVYLDAHVGDVMPAGKILARLDAGDLSAQLAQYQAAVDSAQANLDKLIAGSSTETIAVSLQEVAAAEATYNAAVVELDNAKQNKEKNLGLYRDTALADLDNYLFKAQIAFNGMQEIFDDVDGAKNLSVRNPQYLTNAKTQKNDAAILYSQAQSQTATARRTALTADITTALTTGTRALQTTLTSLDSTYNALVASTNDTNFTASDITTYKTNIKTDQTNTSAGITAFQTDGSNLSTKALAYDNAIATAQSNVTAAQQAWDLAKAKLSLTKADPTRADLAYQQALVNQARGQYAAIYARLADRLIKAPVAGTITAVNNAVGETSSLTAAAIVLLPEQDVEIEVDIPESDIAKVTMGDMTTFTLDAFGDDVKFSGVITLIDPAQTEINGVVYYRVKVGVSATDQPIKPGMTANVDILTDQRSGVIVIPTRAINSRGDTKYVQIMTDVAAQTVVERDVTIGLRGDDGLSEIVTGLSAGEEVVTFVKDNAK